MATGKVIVTDLQGRGKKIFHYGDVVSENSFPEGNFQKLVDGGYIKKEAEVISKQLAPTNTNDVEDSDDNQGLDEGSSEKSDEIEEGKTSSDTGSQQNNHNKKKKKKFFKG